MAELKKGLAALKTQTLVRNGGVQELLLISQMGKKKTLLEKSVNNGKIGKKYNRDRVCNFFKTGTLQSAETYLSFAVIQY